jgi:hypothetical protein
MTDDPALSQQHVYFHFEKFLDAPACLLASAFEIVSLLHNTDKTA